MLPEIQTSKKATGYSSLTHFFVLAAIFANSALTVPAYSQQANGLPVTSLNQRSVSEHKDQKGAQFQSQVPSKPQVVQANSSQSNAKVSSFSANDPVRLTDIIQAVSAFFSMVATVALAAFALRQIKIYQRQTRVMDLTFKASARAVHASTRNAKAAEEALAKSDEVLKHTRETNKSQLRAYLGIDLGLPANSTITILPGGNGSVEISILLKNFGLTPAFGVTLTSQIEIWPYPLSSPLPISTAVSGNGKVNINPGQTVLLNDFKRMSIPNHFIGDINIKKMAAYFKGRIDFRDVFNEHRWIEFFMYSHTGNGGYANFWMCDNGNETSESQSSQY